MADNIDGLIQMLRSDSWLDRINAACALGKIGDPRAAQPLCKALAYMNYDVRLSAAEALVKTGAPAVEPLCEALKESEFPAEKQVCKHAPSRKLNDCCRITSPLTGLKPKEKHTIAIVSANPNRIRRL